MKPAVTFDRVWKRFRRGERHNSLRDLIPSLAGRAVRNSDAVEDKRDFWALKDVSFELAPGEALGIIGPNGAGKSTTLKLLTRILKPTRGACAVHGRIGALIEVAAGFHPDLTGRENIFLQGAIMGMQRADIRRRLDAIIDFAGVSDFVDTPVKRYSSGMNARLGFAIAAHLDPNVLIIDEVLAVGDMAFQDKCRIRMIEFREQGVAIVFVSHNLQAVASLCGRAMFLNRGEIAAAGVPHDVIGAYVEASGGPNTSSGGDSALAAQLLTSAGDAAHVTQSGALLVLRTTFRPSERIENYAFGFRVRRSDDQLVVYYGRFDGKEIGRPVLTGGGSTTIDVEFRAHLTRGHYNLEVHVVHTPTQEVVARLFPAANISVQESRTVMGVADLEATVIPRDDPPSELARARREIEALR